MPPIMAVSRPLTHGALDLISSPLSRLRCSADALLSTRLLTAAQAAVCSPTCQAAAAAAQTPSPPFAGIATGQQHIAGIATGQQHIAAGSGSGVPASPKGIQLRAAVMLPAPSPRGGARVLDGAASATASVRSLPDPTAWTGFPA